MSSSIVLAATALGAAICSSTGSLEHHLPGTSQPSTQWKPRLLVREQRPCGGDRSHPVLYVHGATFPSASSIMYRFHGRSWADELNAAGFDVFGLDFAGYGGSERYPSMASADPQRGPPEGRSAVAAEQIERAVRFIVSLTGTTRVSIIAHSWGTIAAGRFAAAYPELVDRLVLFGAIAGREGASDLETSPWHPVTIAEQHSRFVKDVPRTAEPVLLEDEFPRWAETYLASDPNSGTRVPPAVAVPSGPSADVADAWSGRFPYDMSTITAPVLLVRGEWDSSSTDADADWLQAHLGHAASVQKVVIPRATHLMHLETGRTGLYQATTSFLTRARGSGPAERQNRRSLYAVVFEVLPDPKRNSEYLAIAGRLKPLLADMPGFVENERFRSRTRPGTLLSLSLWDDEAALVRWRTVEKHHAGQEEGRSGVLADYHLRVGEVTDVTGDHSDRRVGWQRWDETQVGMAKAITIIDCLGCGAALEKAAHHYHRVERDVFDHLTQANRAAWLWAWPSIEEATEFATEAKKRLPAGASSYTVRVLRDYSMRDRREAPQYFPRRG